MATLVAQSTVNDFNGDSMDVSDTVSSNNSDAFSTLFGNNTVPSTPPSVQLQVTTQSSSSPLTSDEIKYSFITTKELGTEVFPNVWLGGEILAKNYTQLSTIGITSIVNCTAGLRSHFEDKNINYMRVPVNDCMDEPIGKYFAKAATWINSEVTSSSSKNVLIHCKQGQSRSPSVLIAYAIKFKSKTLKEAYAHVRSKSPAIKINNGFLSQLMAFELETRGTLSVNFFLKRVASKVSHFTPTYVIKKTSKKRKKKANTKGNKVGKKRKAASTSMLPPNTTRKKRKKKSVFDNDKWDIDYFLKSLRGDTRIKPELQSFIADIDLSKEARETNPNNKTLDGGYWNSISTTNRLARKKRRQAQLRASSSPVFSSQQQIEDSSSMADTTSITPVDVNLSKSMNNDIMQVDDFPDADKEMDKSEEDDPNNADQGNEDTNDEQTTYVAMYAKMFKNSDTGLDGSYWNTVNVASPRSSRTRRSVF